MKHLSGVDSLFLAMEHGTQHMHVAGLGIYDPSTAPGGKVRFKSVLAFFAARLGQSKVFRRRLVPSPWGVDRPYWVEDGEIDIEYHVRHIALPHPGDWRQLMIQVARIHSRALDMTKPLWEAYIIEGLDNIPGIPKDSFALYTKFHHSAIDGEAGAELIRAIHSLEPAPQSDPAQAPQALVADREPTPIELYARAIGNRAQQMFQASRLVADLGGRALEAGGSLLASGKAADLVAKAIARVPGADGGLRAVAGADRDMPGMKAHTRFDAPVSAHRVVDAVGFPLADCRKIRAHVDGVTINDIFLAATAGAIRSYLEGKGELPTTTLNALVPLTTRGADKTMDAGNQIGMTAMPLFTDIADPVERLLAVRRSAGRNKAVQATLGRDLPARVLEVLPAPLSERLLRMTLMAMADVVVSNVRGPEMPLYMAGAQLVLFCPVSIAFDGVGLNITGFSYNGTLWVCFVSCRGMMPDPAEFARCLDENFEALVRGAIASGPPRGTRARARARVAQAPAETTVVAARRTAAPRKKKASGG